MIQKTIALLVLVSLQAFDTTESSAQVAKGFRTTVSINYKTGKAIYTVSNQRETAVKIDAKTWLSLFKSIGFRPVLENGEIGNGPGINFLDLKVKIRNKYLGKPHHYSQRDKLRAKIKAETPLVYDNSLDAVKFAETDLPMTLEKGEEVTVEVFLPRLGIWHHLGSGLAKHPKYSVLSHANLYLIDNDGESKNVGMLSFFAEDLTIDRQQYDFFSDLDDLAKAAEDSKNWAKTRNDNPSTAASPDSTNRTAEQDPN